MMFGGGALHEAGVQPVVPSTPVSGEVTALADAATTTTHKHNIANAYQHNNKTQQLQTTTTRHNTANERLS